MSCIKTNALRKIQPESVFIPNPINRIDKLDGSGDSIKAHDRSWAVALQGSATQSESSLVPRLSILFIGFGIRSRRRNRTAVFLPAEKMFFH